MRRIDRKLCRRPGWNPDSALRRENGLFHEGRGGFTLLETVLASSFLVVLFLGLFTVLLFCRRSAASLKWRLAAEAFAYDVAWDVFNRKTSWFDNNVTEDQSTWLQVPAERSSVFFSDSERNAVYNLTILREPEGGGSVTHWRIMADVRWPQPGGRWGRLPEPLVVERHRIERNLFRTGG